MHGDRVARFRALDVERTGLGLSWPGGITFDGRSAARLHRAVEAVLGPRHDARAGRDAMLRRGAAECVHEIGVLRRPLEQRRISRKFVEQWPRRGRSGLLSAALSWPRRRQP